ncbi:hypothetical protein DPMN_164192 [Dreissena polymorpha]|uniref:Uncharacterized protein n=1 Tax=Dreissena polymorpha TaxID=45954 RepID=A0A9D4EUN7_DREPO|nr:hypothetical protein DPMN_164192 [Dreissena polymorpha]
MDTIEFLMQIPGHARCHVDSGFACVKKAYRRNELAAVVDGSSSTNAAVRYPAWSWRN